MKLTGVKPPQDPHQDQRAEKPGSLGPDLSEQGFVCCVKHFSDFQLKQVVVTAEKGKMSHGTTGLLATL